MPLYDAATLDRLETAFPNFAVVDLGTVIKTVAAYDDTTTQYLNGRLVVPSGATGTVTFTATVFPATAAASKNAGLKFEHKEAGDGEAQDGSYTSEDSGAVALDATQDDLTEIQWTETVANLGWAAGDVVAWRLLRDTSVTDDVTGDLYVDTFNVDIPTS